MEGLWGPLLQLALPESGVLLWAPVNSGTRELMQEVRVSSETREGAH